MNAQFVQSYLSLSSHDMQVWLVVPWNTETLKRLMLKKLHGSLINRVLVWEKGHLRCRDEKTQQQLGQWGRQGWVWLSPTRLWNWAQFHSWRDKDTSQYLATVQPNCSWIIREQWSSQITVHHQPSSFSVLQRFIQIHKDDCIQILK